VRATPATIIAHNGELFLPDDNPAFPLDDVVGELTRFTGLEGEDSADDIVDSLSYGVECLRSLGASGGQPPKGVGGVPGPGVPTPLRPTLPTPSPPRGPAANTSRPRGVGGIVRW